MINLFDLLWNFSFWLAFLQIPLSDISEDVLRTSAYWLNNQPVDALGDFVLWCLDSIFTNLALHQAATKGSKKLVQQPLTKSQVKCFSLMRMVLILE